MAFKNFYFKEDQLIEDVSLLNLLFRAVGSDKRYADPSKYLNFVIGSASYAKILNLFTNQVLETKQGNINKKNKIWITNVWPCQLPKLDKLKNISFKIHDKNIQFFSPVARINDAVMFTTNISVPRFIFGIGGAGNIQGDILLIDVNTIPTFEEESKPETTTNKPEGQKGITALESTTNQKLQNIDELEELGWKKNSRQFILSLNNRAAKYWKNLVGLPITTWVSASKLGAVSDPYATANIQAIALKLKETPNPKPEVRQPTETTVNPEQFQTFIIPNENVYNKYLEMIPQTVDFQKEDDIQIDPNKQTKVGKMFTMKNGGKIYVYELNDGIYKLRFNDLGKTVLQKYPSWGLKTNKKKVENNEQ